MSLITQIAMGDLYNPYDFANPVGDQKLFAGRDAEIKDIKYYLRLASRAPRPINLVLTGPRSAGKTSLLNWIESEALEKDFRVARVDLNEGDIDPFSLFYKIYDAILFSAASGGAFAGLEGPVYSDYRATMDSGDSDGKTLGGLLFPQHFASASSANRSLSESTLRTDLRRISQEMGRTCVLLFDECDVLGRSRVELELLRNIFMNTPGYMLVFAGTPNLFPVMEDVFSPIVRQFKKIPVEQFSERNDTLECITKPLEGLGIDPKQIIQPSPEYLGIEVHRLAAGRPYEIQLLCHYMFKRVELGDARFMEISLDVLDDVRHELEKQESGTERRSVGSIKLLEPTDFALLQGLTEFHGNITELSARSRLFGDEDGVFTEQELREAYEKFATLGLLREDEEGRVVFAGDQFDEIYARYVAAANGAEFDVWHLPFRTELRNQLRYLLSRAPDVEIVGPFGSSTSSDEKRRVSDALTALLGPAARSTLPDAAATLYGAVIRSFGRQSVTLCSVTLSVLQLTTQVWITLTSGDTAAFLAEEELVRLSEQARDLGGSVDVEIFEQRLPERADFLAQTRSMSSPNQLEVFAAAHYDYALVLHDEGNYDRAGEEFQQAFALDPSAIYAVSAAHCLLLSGKWGVAEKFAVEARILAISNEDDPELDQYCYATYNLAIARLMSGDKASAQLLLQEALVTSDSEESGYLAVPVSRASGELHVRMIEIEDQTHGIETVISSI